jgi:hypothetical protein
MDSRADYFDLIRQLIRGDHEAYVRRCEQLDDKGWEGLGLVVGATFFRAVRKRFNKTYVAADVIRFVAEFRAEIGALGFDVDPKAAENLVRAALTDETEIVDDLEPSVVVEAEMLMLWKLLQHLTDAELTVEFEEANALAERWSR